MLIDKPEKRLESKEEKVVKNKLKIVTANIMNIASIISMIDLNELLENNLND